MKGSKIEWTDHTFNPWIGCAKVNDGCRFCYAEVLMDTRWGRAQWGPNGTRSKTSAGNWSQPSTWNRDAEKAGQRQRVFCASLADVFEDREDLKPWRNDLWTVIDSTPWLDWLVLTKRPENVRRLWGNPNFRRVNVWLGTSASDQETADTMVPELLKLRDLSPVLFLSAEPMVGPIDFRWRELDWIIVGGESGSAEKVRPFEIRWGLDAVRKCRETEVPCFIKQLGTRSNLDGRLHRTNDPKGGNPKEWPANLRVRQFPSVQDYEHMTSYRKG